MKLSAFLGYYEIDGSLNALALRCYQASKDNGWWDEPREVGTMLMNITSELVEAHEEWRNDSDALHDVHSPAYARVTPDGKPEGFWTEIADVIIRCLDLVGRHEQDIEQYVPDRVYRRWIDSPVEPGSVLMNITGIVAKANDNWFRFGIRDGRFTIDFWSLIAITIHRCLVLAKKFEVDIEQYVVEKIAYNRTRGYRHGGKTA